jgi:ABC-2 type transport system permease protein
MRLAPGSFAWLVAHDVRLNWRRFAGMMGDTSPRKLWVALVAGAAAMHLAAWPIVIWLSPYVYGVDAVTWASMVLLVCTFTWMIAQSLFGATRALYDRGDLDLLLGSPLPAGRVFAAKAAAIAASTFGSIAFLVLPVANTGALIDRAAWLGIYPSLIGMALVATAIALALSIGLFFLVGPRRARVYTQLTGAAIGGAFVLGAQIYAMLPSASQAGLSRWLETLGLSTSSARCGLPCLPIDAVRGDAVAMMIMLGLGGLYFVAAVKLLGNRFARASLAAAGASAAAGTSNSRRDSSTFRGGLARSLMRKEWRLLVRDPNLFAQVSLQIIYTVPVAVVLLRSESLPAALALAPTIVVVAAQISASLAWITVSGEDAPELIATAPVSPADVDRAKLNAVFMPVLVIMALPLIGLAIAQWEAALIAGLFAGAAGASTALLNFWHPMPGNRRGMLRRHSQSKVIALVEHAIAVLWAIAIVLALMGTILTIIPVLLAFAVLAFFRSKHRVAAMGKAKAARAGSGTAIGQAA